MSALAPELALLTGALLFLALAPVKRPGPFLLGLVALLGPVCGAATLAAAILTLRAEATFFSGAYALGPFSQACKPLLAVVLLTLTVAGGRLPGIAPRRRVLHQALLCLAVFAVMVAAGATRLPLLAAALILGGPGPFLALFPRADAAERRRGALADFALFEAAAVLLTLFGMGCLYVLGGADLAAIAESARQGKMPSPWATAGFLFALVLPFFRASLWPMQRLLPDLCRGAAVESAGMLAVLPGIGGLIALFRLLPCLPPGHGRFVSLFFVLLGLLAVLAAALAAQTEDELKPFLARQCVGRFGWVLLVLSPLTPDSIAAALYAALCAIAAALPCWLALPPLGRDHHEPRLGDLHGLARTRPAAAGLLAAALLGLAGIPPLAGFMVTLSALSVLIGASPQLAAAFVAPAGLAAVLALAPCLRALRALCAVKKRGAPAFAPLPALCFTLGAALILTQLLLGLLPARFLELAAQAARGL